MYTTSKINAVRRHRMCLRKAKFKTEAIARKVADEKEKQYNCKNNVYYCPLCGNWHITTVKE